MGVKIITPAAAAITLDELREQLRLPDTSDAMLLIYLAAAQEYAQHATQRAIGAQTLELALPAFPSGPIDLPLSPVTSITSIVYVDAQGATQTLSGSAYSLNDYELVHSVQPLGDWPATRADTPLAVKVRYVAGSLPPAVKSALLLIVAHLDANRESTTLDALKELPLGVNAMLDTVRNWSF